MWCFIRHISVHRASQPNVKYTELCVGVCMLALNVLNVMGNKQWNQVCESAVRHCKIFESLMIQRTRYIRPHSWDVCCSWAAVQYDIRHVNANANATAFINATNDTEFIYKMPKLLIFPIRANSFSFRVATNERHIQCTRNDAIPWSYNHFKDTNMYAFGFCLWVDGVDSCIRC